MFPLLTLLAPLGKAIFGQISTHFESKRKLREARQASELKWAETMAKATESSWKDEYITIVITLPIVAAMFGYPELGERAFQMMHLAPEWFTVAFMTVVGGSFGVSLFGKYKSITNGGWKNIDAKKPSNDTNDTGFINPEISEEE